MATFITGSTGYLGAHTAVNLLQQSDQSLNLLVRAKDRQEAQERLWRALQLHLNFPTFYEFLRTRVNIFLGDLTDRKMGLPDDEYTRLVKSTDSIIHCAASLNRKSEKSCLNVNVRGTLEVITCAQAARDDHGLRRFSHVSTVAVAGHRRNELVREDDAIDWDRSDYDPYARTKKLCEHMLRELLPDVPITMFRPSIILGDSRHEKTTQFDMVVAFVFLADLPVLPFRPDDRLDIVPIDYVADAVVALHLKDHPVHDVYHLSSGIASQTYRELTDALSRIRGKRHPFYLPALERPVTAVVEFLSNRRGWKLSYGASLLKVFMPYLVWNTVFDNTRVVEEIGRAPAPFVDYCYPLLKFARQTQFTYPYQEWPRLAKEVVT